MVTKEQAVTSSGSGRTRRVYIVGHNMAGYLGDNDPYFVGTKRRAIAASLSEAHDALEAYNDGIQGMGSDWRQYRYSRSGRKGDYWLTAERGATYHYWIVETVAERVTVSSPASEWDRIRCANCETGIEPGDSAWYVAESEAYLCVDCL